MFSGVLQIFRDHMNRTIPLRDFICKASEDLLSYAASFYGINGPNATCTDKTYESGASLATTKQNCLTFFNTPRAKSLQPTDHNHYPTRSDRKSWCVLCQKQGMKGNRKGRSIMYLCTLCTVPLCLTVPVGMRKTC